MTRLVHSVPLRSVLPPTLIATRDVLAEAILRRELAELGLEIRCVSCLPDAKSAVASGAYGVVLVDMTAPGTDGFEVLRAARASDSDPVVILLSSRNDVGSRVYGLESGADDCLTMPVHGEELRARVKALLRRREASVRATSDRVVIGARWFDRASGVASTNEGQLVLSKRELLLMRRFVEREGEVLTRNDLLDAAWGIDANPTDRTIDNFIVRLRRFFEPNPGEPTVLLTIRARGYVFRRGPAIS
jgi:DNA-binding response OmpR family regulator